MVRGSTVSGYKWINGKPFNPQSSGIDLTFVGRAALAQWSGPKQFLGQRTTFLTSEENTAESLYPLVVELESVFGRSVSIVGSGKPLFWGAQFVQRTPYLTLLEK